MIPTTLEEYERLFHANSRVSGYGAETTMHMPCPFCAAPDFLVHNILDTEAAMTKGAVCKVCHRGIRALFERDAYGTVKFTFVQTVGDDPPDYLPQMEREQA